jgi:hypothetical protein
MINTVLLIRPYLVILLVFLQLAAPLIHAHTNAAGESGKSLHLPEFEQINSLLQEGASLITPPFQDGEMVTVSAGIKQEQRRLLLNNNFNAFVALSLFIIAVLQNIPYCFFIKAEPIKTFDFFNLIAPCAPPLSLVPYSQGNLSL